MGNFISTEDVHTKAELVEHTLQTGAEEVRSQAQHLITPVVQDVRRIRDTARRYIHIVILALLVYLILFLILFVMQVMTLVKVSRLCCKVD